MVYACNVANSDIRFPNLPLSCIEIILPMSLQFWRNQLLPIFVFEYFIGVMFLSKYKYASEKVSKKTIITENFFFNSLWHMAYFSCLPCLSCVLWMNLGESSTCLIEVMVLSIFYHRSFWHVRYRKSMQHRFINEKIICHAVDWYNYQHGLIVFGHSLLPD